MAAGVISAWPTYDPDAGYDGPLTITAGGDFTGWRWRDLTTNWDGSFNQALVKVNTTQLVRFFNPIFVTKGIPGLMTIATRARVELYNPFFYMTGDALGGDTINLGGFYLFNCAYAIIENGHLMFCGRSMQQRWKGDYAAGDRLRIRFTQFVNAQYTHTPPGDASNHLKLRQNRPADNATGVEGFEISWNEFINESPNSNFPYRNEDVMNIERTYATEGNPTLVHDNWRDGAWSGTEAQMIATGEQAGGASTTGTLLQVGEGNKHMRVYNEIGINSCFSGIACYGGSGDYEGETDNVWLYDNRVTCPHFSPVTNDFLTGVSKNGMSLLMSNHHQGTKEKLLFFRNHAASQRDVNADGTREGGGGDNHFLNASYVFLSDGVTLAANDTVGRRLVDANGDPIDGNGALHADANTYRNISQSGENWSAATAATAMAAERTTFENKVAAQTDMVIGLTTESPSGGGGGGSTPSFLSPVGNLGNDRYQERQNLGYAKSRLDSENYGLHKDPRESQRSYGQRIDRVGRRESQRTKSYSFAKAGSVWVPSRSIVVPK